ncbi:valyl-tRNA synthetase [Cenarchaeum symbiosum A]|uniref:Valine--tRNA ligase n=1 Tax=Cenarchaeum symbiosum (strain A) TaxID=414004 RepID=A0RWH5_CENSY|nr:valyl-tRNA synthetase [Cenarchaeum symbiosum A]
MDKTEPKIAAKSWDPALEGEVRKRWNSEGLYSFKPAPNSYTIDTPPPYPSGRPWHIGAAAHYSQIDMIARTARMAGKNVYFPLGIDRNGLPVELYTEKKHKLRMRDINRDEFLSLCRGTLDELEAEMLDTMEALGLSCNVRDCYRTDSDEYRTLTQSTFIHLWKKGLIYKATRPNNYDWTSGTTIADAEISYEELPTKLVHMKFTAGTGQITIASTRPELLCACRAVIVCEDDERYSGLVGSEVTVPVYGNKVPVLAHPSVKRDFGSGAVMVCSYGDQNDVALFRELGLSEVAAIGLDGRMTGIAGAYTGLRPKQAREKIIHDLEEGGHLEKVEDILHRTPVSERSRTPIEIIPMEEYYLKQVDSIPRIRELSKDLQFHPPMHRQILENWLDSVSMDWPISRRRYYGTEIPVWHCASCSEPYVPEPGRYYRPWMEQCPADSCASCGGTKFEGEQRIFDTWMDSSVSPLFISKYGKDDKFFESTYPAGLRPQAKDIVRTWLYYTMLRCDQLTGKRPWSEAWIMGYGLDERGQKMSKRAGNSIDPLPLVKRIGADAFRLWSAGEVSHGHDFRCNEDMMVSTKKFLSKLWNVSRFLSGFSSADAEPSAEPDRWILSELDKLVSKCQEGYEKYDFFVPAVAIREFTWNIFAAHYIELVKGRAYGDPGPGRDSAISTLHRVLSTILLLLAPITPFITDYLWRELYSKDSIHLESAPRPSGAPDMSSITEQLTAFNSTIWNKKKELGLSLKDSVEAEVPAGLSGFASDLCSMHNIGEKP